MKKLLILVAFCALATTVLACDDDPSDGASDVGDTSSDGSADAPGDTSPDLSSDAGDTTDDNTADGGDDVDSGAGPDTDDTGGDVPPDGDGLDCLAVEALDSWVLTLADDVSVSYSVAITPQVDDTYAELLVLFERYTEGPDVGTFTLGSGNDADFGGCAHCLALWVPGTEEGYFADRGTLTTTLDPYSRRLEASVTNLRLVEVTIDPLTRGSTRVLDGACVEVADFSVDEVFPPDGWSCNPEHYGDGEQCHCDCGADDSDCYATWCAPFDPDCVPTEPLPIADCDEGDVCSFNPVPGRAVCTEACDWAGRDGCTEGTCVFDFGVGDGDTCFTDEERLSDAAIGEDCGAGFLQRVCALADGFAEGFCDWNNVCQPLCDEPSDCTVEGEQCWRFRGEDGLGWCGPPFEDG